MNKDFKFRTGKYAGKTYRWVMDNNPKYIAWIKENQPKMLVDRPVKVEAPKVEVKVSDIKVSDGLIPFNEDFGKQPPNAMSIPFMLGDRIKYSDKLEAFRLVNKTQYRKIIEAYEAIPGV